MIYCTHTSIFDQKGVWSELHLSRSRKKLVMNFEVTYRLTHPEYVSTVSHTIVSAQTHQQRDLAIAKLVKKWEEQGYTVRVLAVRKRPVLRRKCL
jgi:hypothetical protein